MPKKINKNRKLRRKEERKKKESKRNNWLKIVNYDQRIYNQKV